jgi:hypothetical protein
MAVSRVFSVVISTTVSRTDAVRILDSWRSKQNESAYVGRFHLLLGAYSIEKPGVKRDRRFFSLLIRPGLPVRAAQVHPLRGRDAEK